MVIEAGRVASSPDQRLTRREIMPDRSVPFPAVDFAAIFTALPLPCVVLAPDLTVLAVNDLFLRQTRTERDALVGAPLFAVASRPGSDGPDFDALRASAEAALAGAPQHVPGQGGAMPRSSPSDGSAEEPRWTVRTQPLVGRAGDITCLVQSWDIEAAVPSGQDAETPSPRASAPQEREAYLQSILDTVPDGMVVIDGRGAIELFSKTAEKVFGYGSAEVVGRNVKMLMPPAEREQHDDYLTRYHATGTRKIIGIGRVVLGERKDGSTFPLQLSVGEIAGKDRFVGFVRDMTERQETEASLRQMQAELVHMSRFTALGEMASALAHELNQPLTAIANYLKGCRRLLDQGEPATMPMLKGAVDQAADQALRAGQIIRRLRDFVARGESERHLENLPKLIDEACALALIGASESGVRVVFDLDPDAKLVYADRIQIQQVLVNLIRNAVEAMQETTTRLLTVSTASGHDGTVEISVADTGTGLDPEVAAHLFQPFLTTKKNGMGVGLSICRTIVEAHDGKIWAGASAGGGTFFRFTLREGLR